MKQITLFLLPLMVLGMLAGCSDSGQPAEVKTVRVVPPAPEKPAAEAGKTDPHAGLDMSGMGAMAGPSPHQLKVEGDAPAEWKSETPTSMRVLNYTVKDHPEAQCYVTVLPGAAGGKTANLNRWREQMGQPALSEAEIAALPTLDVLEQKASFLEAAGNFAGMSGESTQDAMLYGVVCELGANSVFVKMTGPKTVLEGQKEAFQTFCKSLRVPK